MSSLPDHPDLFTINQTTSLFHQDQVKVVESFSEHGVQFMDRANEFMKGVAALEIEYARKVQNLAKQHREEITRKASDKTNAQFYKAVLGSTLTQCWNFILGETENIATYRLEAAEKLDTEIRKSLKHRAKDNERSNKQHFDDIRKANADLKKAIDNLERMQQRYEKAMKDMELAKNALDTADKDQNTTKKLLDQLKAEVDKKAIAAQEASAAYKQCMAECNEIKNKHFTEILPSILDMIQKEDEENKTSFCKTNFQQYIDLFASLTPKYDQSFKLMSKSVDTIKPTGDADFFITVFKTGEPIPSDFQMSDTQEADLGKKTFMKGMSRVREDKGDDQVEDQIIALPGKQGRKKAVDRIKVIEKEMSDVEKKRQGVDNLISVYKEKSPSSADSKVMDDLMDQKTNIERRLDTLALKRHKLLVYIANFDGTTPPDMPVPMHERSPSKIFASPATGTVHSSTPSSSTARDSPGTSVSYLGTLGTNAWEVSGSKDSISSTGRNGGGPSFSGTIPVTLSGAASEHARVLYDFEAAPGSQEMSVKAGQVLDVIDKQDDGWWLCRFNGREGYVPGNYTELIS